MSKEKSEIDDLLDDLETESMGLSTIPEQRERKPVKVEEIDGENAKNMLYKSMSKVFNKLERVSEELVNRIEEGDTYESTLQGFAAVTGNITNAMSKMDAIEARREKMKHEKEMAEIKRKNKLEELEKRNSGKSTPTNIQNNNHFYGSITDVMREVNKLEKSDDKEIVDAIEVD